MFFCGIPIIITTKTVQCRKHHKYRINKKWKKRYGFKEFDMQPKGQIIELNGSLYMTQSDYDKLNKTTLESIFS